ncbi:hypothetical protein C4J81_10325 [Deltaproteobacteria bacterium Smac51]|nr:hypothetical protein C4J81_10325 [Deltaproteobacteria bacterium Smac51]
MKKCILVMAFLPSIFFPVILYASESSMDNVPIDELTTVEDLSKLYEILSALPDQIMAVLLAYLCFKTFADMVK